MRLNKQRLRHTPALLFSVSSVQSQSVQTAAFGSNFPLLYWTLPYSFSIRFLIVAGERVTSEFGTLFASSRRRRGLTRYAWISSSGQIQLLFFFVKFSSKWQSFVLFSFAASSSSVVVAEVLIVAVGAVWGDSWLPLWSVLLMQQMKRKSINWLINWLIELLLLLSRRCTTLALSLSLSASLLISPFPTNNK